MQINPRAFVPRMRVTGTYLSQPFAATIVMAKPVDPNLCALTLDLDTPVDVVSFDSFSNFRKRIRGVVGPKGVSAERTSNGEPQLVIDFPAE